MSPFAQNFSVGDSGKKMPTRASTRNDRVHNDMILLTAGGSAALSEP
jgi:argininosuccinate lyase